jgi:hypothetical protein
MASVLGGDGGHAPVGAQTLLIRGPRLLTGGVPRSFKLTGSDCSLRLAQFHRIQILFPIIQTASNLKNTKHVLPLLKNSPNIE